ncbi:hypothetical protein Tco_0822966 [Tanacetum coccineum]|uniref:Uncharacterized protein n=1 Tax=Tanacetum coccineum TaxID=301880 RepID=A0ABQ5AJV3_9ASTR
MHQFWYTIKKIQGTNSYEFVLANKRCVVDAEVFRKILDICPRVEGEEFTEVQDDDATLTFFIDLGYKGPLHEHTNMYVDHMHQPWRTLETIINKSLSKKTASNDRLRKFKIDILLVPSCFTIFSFEPLTFSLTSMPSCDLESLTNILILYLILKALDQSLGKYCPLNLDYHDCLSL